MTAVFSSVLYSQTSDQKCVLKRATFATVRHMRRRWNLPLSWKPLYRRLSSAKACSSNLAPSLHQAVRTIYIKRRVLISPEETNSLQSSWLTSDLEHGALRCTYLLFHQRGLTPFPPSLWLTGDNNHHANRKQGLTPTMLPLRT